MRGISSIAYWPKSACNDSWYHLFQCWHHLAPLVFHTMVLPCSIFLWSHTPSRKTDLLDHSDSESIFRRRPSAEEKTDFFTTRSLMGDWHPSFNCHKPINFALAHYFNAVCRDSKTAQLIHTKLLSFLLPFWSRHLWRQPWRALQWKLRRREWQRWSRRCCTTTFCWRTTLVSERPLCRTPV